MLVLQDSDTVYDTRLLQHTATEEVANAQWPAFTLHVGTRQDPGLRRKYRPNEDTLSITQGIIPAASPSMHAMPYALMLVADGMGGHAHGKEASLLATHSFTRYISETLLHQPKSAGELLFLLGAAMQHANDTVFEHNLREQTNIGTTMTAAIVVESTAYIAHVGDSRLYLYHEPDGLMQITHDHSFVAELVLAGVIEHDEIYTHPRRNQIYRSLGTEAFVEVDVYAVPLALGDILLLCTDGLWEMVRDPQITSILTTPMPDPTDTADALMVAALAKGGLDNISAIVAQVNAKNQPRYQPAKVG